MCECADPPLCTVYTCAHPPVCDDGDPCTDNVCTLGDCDQVTCDYPCLADCTPCPGGVCESCECVADPCSLTIREITFGDDHTMYEEAGPCDDTGKCWGSGAALTGPAWKSENNPDQPVAYTQGTTMRLVVRLDATGGASGTATLRVTGPDGISGEGTLSVPCQSTEERFVTIVTSGLPDVLKAYTPAGLSWSVQCPGDTIYRPAGSTSRRLYVTLGTPTARRTAIMLGRRSAASMPTQAWSMPPIDSRTLFLLFMTQN
ncbi:MAG: hypothetical protein JSU86_08470, partial [Phycisphaerales bacterium]